MKNLSVLMSIYASESAAFLDLALESLRNQTLKASEVIIVEDGLLNDELLDTVEKFRSDLNIVSVKLPQNVGLGVALNKGLEHCSYQLVARMDSDDIALPHRFAEQVAYFSKHQEIDVLGSWIREFEMVPGDIPRIRKLPLTHSDLFKFAKRRCPINHMTVMYKKAAVLRSGGYPKERGLEDYRLWVRMLLDGAQFANLPLNLVDARIGNNMLARRGGLIFAIKESYVFLGIL